MTNPKLTKGQIALRVRLEQAGAPIRDRFRQYSNWTDKMGSVGTDIDARNGAGVVVIFTKVGFPDELRGIKKAGKYLVEYRSGAGGGFGRLW